MSDYPLEKIIRSFPGLTRQHKGQSVIYADAPGGTQVPLAVSEAIRDYLHEHNANLDGPFASSEETTRMVETCRFQVARFLNARHADEISFGQNMTSLCFALSRAISSTWKAGDAIIITDLDHDANVFPWILAAKERGVIVHTLRFDQNTGVLSSDELQQLLSAQVRLLALSAASNALGTIIDLKPFIEQAHCQGAMVVVDAVHLAPHHLLDVEELDCDFLFCSPYKFWGPHIGIMYAKNETQEKVTPYKIRPISDASPGRWETGTQNFEGIAGLSACLNYITSIDNEMTVPEQISRHSFVRSMQRIRVHEETLSKRALEHISRMNGVQLQLHGIRDPSQLAQRTPTFAFSFSSHCPKAIAHTLADHGIYTWHGHFYAIGVTRSLRLDDKNGLLRIGFTHYHRIVDSDRVFHTLADILK